MPPFNRDGPLIVPRARQCIEHVMQGEAMIYRPWGSVIISRDIIMKQTPDANDQVLAC